MSTHDRGNSPGRAALRSILPLLLLAIAGLALWWYLACGFMSPCKPAAWTSEEIASLRSLQLASLAPPPPDPSNAVADNPRAAELGHRLFFDSRLSAKADVSCATCHQPERYFTDGRAKGKAIAESQRNTSSIVGSSYSPWLYWDGRRDSLWSQALAPLEDPAEHGGNRMQVVRLIADDPRYRRSYEELFGALPDFSNSERFPEAASPLHSPEWQAAWESMECEDQQQVNQVFANLGKAIAAYERLLLPGPSRFDAYVEAVIKEDAGRQADTFREDEVRGLRLFMGKARCIECHNGPLLTNNEFHNTGVLTFPGELPDRGRSKGLSQLQADIFNCMGSYSDLPPKDCLELRYIRSGQELIGAMRTPSLRNVTATAPFMHKGQMSSLMEVLDHYNEAPPAIIGHNESEPLGLRRRELEQLEAFLHTLSAPPSTSPQWLAAPAD